jgi:1-acyl-sn-glycerol-3-phosphate acyltransferase
LSAGTPVEKPRSQVIRPELTRLPPLTPWRRSFRRLASVFFRLLVSLFTRTQVVELENFPERGPLLVVVNHLGDTDVILGMAYFPISVDALAKMELYDYPVLGAFMEAYGSIWVHRGAPDRRALRAALQGLEEGRVIGIAPEGRESVTGALEEGMGGAAFLALKANVPLLPVTFTGTENKKVIGSLIRFRRPKLTMTVGPIFRLEDLPDRRKAVDAGTDQIMRRLAQQLPEAYRGIYMDQEDQ